MTKRISARARIVVGLVTILTSVLMVALAIGIVPDEANAVMKGRARLCEALAVNSSVLVGRDDIRRLEAVLQALVHHNDDILSAAVRRDDGEIVTEVGDHTSRWEDVSRDLSIDTQVFVPIRAGDEKWGGVEVRFSPVQRRGLVGFLQAPWTKVVAFVSAVCFFLYWLYLGRMLQYLNPSKAVPGRVRSALDTLAEGLMVLDRQGRIVLANQAFAECVGRSPDRLLGVRASSLPWSNSSDQTDPVVHPWLQAVNGTSRQDGVVMQLATDVNGVRTFVVNCSPIQGQNGQHRGILVSLEDVSQLEEARVQLKVSRDVAEKANAAKSAFLARMSHEIRTPMNAILGFTDVLLRGYAESEMQRQDYLNTIHSSGTHLLDLINDILDLSKIEAGRMEVELVRCAPYPLVSQIVTALRIRAQEKGITCDVSVESDLPETILTDPVRFRQVLTNLIGNAIKFTENGGVKVVIRMIQPSERPKLAVDVIDTGAGMPRESLARIFDPFSQADVSVTRKFGGTGLGLSISRRLAEALGGQIVVESEPGEGSIFTATFDTGPLEGVPVLSRQTLGEPSLAIPRQDHGPLLLPPGRILVADDGEANCKLISVVLGRAGVDVTTVSNGQMAVSFAAKEHFDAIVMDMQMPVMDGYTATATLRRQGFERPIIALTADAMDGSEDKCRDAGCSHFLTKPLDMDLLTSTLSRILDGNPASHRMLSSNGEQGSADEMRRTTRHGNRESSSLQPNDPPSDRSPVTSSLPMGDAEFRAIVVGYVDRLQQQLLAMRQAHEQGHFAELAHLAHWLKGSAATVGFTSFTAPALELEQLAKEKRTDAIGAQLEILFDLAERIVVPDLEEAEPLAAR